MAEFFDKMNVAMRLKRGDTLQEGSWTKFVGGFYQRTTEGWKTRLPASYYLTIISELGLSQEAKGGSSPATHDQKPMTAEEKLRWDEPLSRADTFCFRRIVGKLRFAVPWRPDLLHA